MIYISHRGNLFGKEYEKENSILNIEKCLDLNFDVEIDIWYINKSFYLGHDFPKYKIEEKYLTNPNLWCHAKNFDALFFMTKNTNIHCFWHETDAYTITSKGIIWAYPGSILNEKTVCVLPELRNTYSIEQLNSCYGICSDHIIKYKEQK